MVQRVNVVSDHSASALANALEHHNLFLLPVWRTLGKARWLVAARTLPKTVAVVAAVAAVIAALVLVQADLNLEGKGTLQPAIRRDVFAGIEGTVKEVKVVHGQKVTQNEVLAKLRNTELEVQLTTVLGKIKEAEESLRGVRRNLNSTRRTGADEQRHLTTSDRIELKSKESQLVQDIQNLNGQRELYEEKKKLLDVTSPIDGQITTWEPENLLLTRTVQPTNVLLNVADPTGPWELEVLMPEDRMGHVLRAQRELGKELKVAYILANDPGTTHYGKIKEVHLSAEPRGEQGNTVLVRVTLDDKSELGDNLSQGAGVTAKMHCGRRSLGYVWFHDLLAFVQSRILFKL